MRLNLLNEGFLMAAIILGKTSCSWERWRQAVLPRAGRISYWALTLPRGSVKWTKDIRVLFRGDKRRRSEKVGSCGVG